ncbi:MAG: DUF3822 family protein, partial [Flavobacteriaceae bacterium]|nr:DUF3822 family protein [Flavobacteriaceae bacterium]
MMSKKKVQITNNTDYSYLKDSHLSIQLSLDGFSFCIINKKTNEVTEIIHHPFIKKSTTPQKH